MADTFSKPSAEFMTELPKKTPEIVEDAEAIRLRELRQERRELGVLSHVFPSGREHRARLDAEIAKIRELRETLARSTAPEPAETKEQAPGQLDTLRSKRDQLMAQLSTKSGWRVLARNSLIGAIANIDRQTARVFDHSRAA